MVKQQNSGLGAPVMLLPTTSPRLFTSVAALLELDSLGREYAATTAAEPGKKSQETARRMILLSVWAYTAPAEVYGCIF